MNWKAQNFSNVKLMKISSQNLRFINMKLKQILKKNVYVHLYFQYFNDFFWFKRIYFVFQEAMKKEKAKIFDVGMDFYCDTIEKSINDIDSNMNQDEFKKFHQKIKRQTIEEVQIPLNKQKLIKFITKIIYFL